MQQFFNNMVYIQQYGEKESRNRKMLRFCFLSSTISMYVWRYFLIGFSLEVLTSLHSLVNSHKTDN